MRRRASPGERALVLGGSRGLGLLLAHELLSRGTRVVIAARDESELAEAVAALERASRVQGGVSAVRCNVEDESEVRRAVDVARERLGGIDVLVNNAGLIQVGPLDAMRVEDFDQALRVHLRGPLVASLAVADEMRARGSGHIINISSIGGLVPIPHLLPYVASKFALTGLSQGLHVELAKDGVKVTTVCPGLMRTGSSYRATFKSQHKSEHAWFALGGATPLTSMSARRAAREIIDAAQRGAALVVLSWQAKLLATLHALAPGTTLSLIGAVNRWLPAFGGIGQHALEGRYSWSRWAPSWATRLNDQAAIDYGELGSPRLNGGE
jgi:short-subunit dehydrogenase